MFNIAKFVENCLYFKLLCSLLLYFFIRICYDRIIFYFFLVLRSTLPLMNSLYLNHLSYYLLKKYKICFTLKICLVSNRIC